MVVWLARHKIGYIADYTLQYIDKMTKSTSKQRIENAAKDLHVKIWDQRHILFPNQSPTYLHILEPSLAAQVLGITYREQPDLGINFQNGDKSKAAGLMYREMKAIVINSAFPPEQRRFTGAHEIGHYLLHHQETLHRDRPIGNTYNPRQKRPLIEEEADCFAACFLIPEKLLRQKMQQRFQTKLPFRIDEHAAHQLCHNDPDSLIYAEDNRVREMAVARATRYNNHYFDSLASYFRVSPTAMAVRISELELILWP